MPPSIPFFYAIVSSYERLMERDNKKARDDAKKEYNETVRVRRIAAIRPSSQFQPVPSPSPPSFASAIPGIRLTSRIKLRAGPRLREPVRRLRDPTSRHRTLGPPSSSKSGRRRLHTITTLTSTGSLEKVTTAKCGSALPAVRASEPRLPGIATNEARSTSRPSRR